MATEKCQTLSPAVLCNLWRHGIVWSVLCAVLWSLKEHSCCLLGVDSGVGGGDLVSPYLRDIIIVPGNAEWCRKTGVQQMWGLVRNFICHGTLQQTSLLIGSPWIRLGIWTVCSWTDWMMSFCALIATHTCTRTRTHSSYALFQACLSYFTPAACKYLCYKEALGAITPSSGCFNFHDKNMGALHCTHCTSNMIIAPPPLWSFHSTVMQMELWSFISV